MSLTHQSPEIYTEIHRWFSDHKLFCVVRPYEPGFLIELPFEAQEDSATATLADGILAYLRLMLELRGWEMEYLTPSIIVVSEQGAS